MLNSLIIFFANAIIEMPKGKFKNLNKYFSIKKIFLNMELTQLVGVVSANSINFVFF